jgi:hypothetical protein
MGMKMITKIDRMIIEMIYKLYLYGLVLVQVVLVFVLLVIQVLVLGLVDMIRVKVLMEVR